MAARSVKPMLDDCELENVIARPEPASVVETPKRLKFRVTSWAPAVASIAVRVNVKVRKALAESPASAPEPVTDHPPTDPLGEAVVMTAVLLPRAQTGPMPLPPEASP